MGNVSKVSAGQETAKTPVMRLFYVSAVFTLQRHTAKGTYWTLSGLEAACVSPLLLLLLHLI